MYGSPNGKYISYFKDNDWWTYNVKRKIHVNLSGKLKYPFFGKVNLLASDDPYGNPGWSRSNDEILLYDEFDIWALKPDGSSARRLTRGREKKSDSVFMSIGRTLENHYMMHRLMKLSISMMNCISVPQAMTERLAIGVGAVLKEKRKFCLQIPMLIDSSSM
ncbi:hypothetical protein ACQ9BO_09360 [Flavobacterium sp. P21]|uniref:hypothetical protein n=1 Tax=Flavobacterium sp. P21 TaxID=3423948 RepID=UPI003D6712CB